MKYKNYYQSPIGPLTLVSENNKLVAVSFKDIDTAIIKESSILTQTKEWLDRYFAKEKPNITEIEFELQGTKFQQEVWSILLEIPYGQILTYGQIANVIAKKRGIRKMSSQAVGNAVGSNPLAIIVPCHRVIGINGDLTGYGGGISKKIDLLKLEGSFKNEFYYDRIKHNF